MNPQLIPSHVPAPLPPTVTISATESASEETGAPPAHYLWVLKRQRWKILAFVVACVTATMIVSSRLTPIYEATATVNVDRNTPTGVIGPDAARPIMGDTDQFLATQMRLIQSDAVVRPVIRQFHLVNYQKLSDQAQKNRIGDPEDAPATLSGLSVSRPPNTYILLISYRSPDPQLAANVANAIAKQYEEHMYNIRFRASANVSSFMEKQLEELKAKMEKSSAAVAAFEKELNVINPEEKTSILTARLLQLNTEYTNAQQERLRKQAAADSVKSGTIEAAQVSVQGEALRKLGEDLAESQTKFAQVRGYYGAGHPEYKKAQAQVNELERQLERAKQNTFQRVTVEYQQAENREAMLKKALDETKAEFDALNTHSFEYRNLKQEAETDKNLYQELMRKIREAGINSSFQDSSIRIADTARPPIAPVFPKTKTNAVLALLCSLILAVVTAILSDAIDGTIRDPETIRRTLRTEAIGSLPLVKRWHREMAQPLGEPTSAVAPRAGAKPRSQQDDHVSRFQEAVRTVRDSILLSDLARRPRSILITSAVPSEGKTTTCVHVSLAHAAQNRRTLLIDADLRRPAVHGRLGIANGKGLSDTVKEQLDWKEVVCKSVGYPTLDVLTAGSPSRHIADRLGPQLSAILSEAVTMYDLVIVDVPPILGFAEPLQISSLVDGVVLLAKAGQTNRNAMAMAVDMLRRLKVNLIGIILNEVHADVSDSYYYYYYSNYNKYYKAYDRA